MSMLVFSDDPDVAATEVEGVVFYLTAFGYIDGDFDPRERAFVREYLAAIAQARVPADTAAREIALEAEEAALARVFEAIDREIGALWDEPTAEGERSLDFVRARLKLRCFEIFNGFDGGTQARLMDAVDELLMADGVAHPEELQFRRELCGILATRIAAPPPPPLPAGLRHQPTFAPPPPLPPVTPPAVPAGSARSASARTPRPSGVAMASAIARPAEGRNEVALTRLEHHYSREPSELRRQLDADLSLIERVTATLARQRAGHAGKLAGHQTVDAFDGQAAFLDGHVYVEPLTHPKGYELTVLGDLHGCYSCLKAALMQSDFLGKVRRFERAPEAHPEPKLILLGDYIDRGLFSYNGVLRTALRLFEAAPRHVYVLRGNHEYYVEHEGEVYGGVRPAEAINTLRPHAANDVFAAYKRLFEELPNMLLFDRALFVHGGIPRDATWRERYSDLSSLNDAELRFEMMWSDPSRVDTVPDALQAQSARFPFGRMQAKRFLHRMGLTTLVRGHQKVEAGIARVYDEADLLLLTLFSAGGDYNDDLPLMSSYRFVTPMALTMRYSPAGEVALEPWVIDWASYNDPDKNAFFRSSPQIPHQEH